MTVLMTPMWPVELGWYVVVKREAVGEIDEVFGNEKRQWGRSSDWVTN